jgi:hypothetical protein
MRQPAAESTHHETRLHPHPFSFQKHQIFPLLSAKNGSLQPCGAAAARHVVQSPVWQEQQQQHQLLQQQQQQYHLPTLQQYDDFELLWLEYRHELSISKTAAVWALQDVQLGLLPCDADLLRERAQQFTALANQGSPRNSSSSSNSLDTRRILNSSRHVLVYDAL